MPSQRPHLLLYQQAYAKKVVISVSLADHEEDKTLHKESILT